MRKILYINKVKMMFFVVLFFVFSSGVNIYSSNNFENVEFITYTVLPGDTLWSIACKYENKFNRINYVNELERINKLKNDVIIPGDKLAIPIYK